VNAHGDFNRLDLAAVDRCIGCILIGFSSQEVTQAILSLEARTFFSTKPQLLNEFSAGLDEVPSSFAVAGIAFAGLKGMAPFAQRLAGHESPKRAWGSVSPVSL
jgi:hypothetical protein